MLESSVFIESRRVSIAKMQVVYNLLKKLILQNKNRTKTRLANRRIGACESDVSLAMTGLLAIRPLLRDTYNIHLKVMVKKNPMKEVGIIFFLAGGQGRDSLTFYSQKFFILTCKVQLLASCFLFPVSCFLSQHQHRFLSLVSYLPSCLIINISS